MSFNIPARIWSVHFITVSIIILFLFELVCKNKNSNESCVSHQSVCVHTVQSLAIKAIMAHGKTKRNTRSWVTNWRIKDERNVMMERMLIFDLMPIVVIYWQRIQYYNEYSRTKIRTSLIKLETSLNEEVIFIKYWSVTFYILVIFLFIYYGEGYLLSRRPLRGLREAKYLALHERKKFYSNC